MTEFRKPDLSAPRFRRKTTNILNKKLYKAFIAKHPERENIDLTTFRNIVTTYNGALWNAALVNRDGIELPESLGYIVVAKCDKAKKDNTDFVASVKYGKRVNHANWDSDNYLAKICYTNYSLKYRFGDRELWGFSAVKQFRHSVSKDFSKRYTNYVHLTNKLKPHQLYKK